MNTQIHEEAADWIVRNRNGVLDAASKAQFDEWLRRSPENIQAYLEMSSLWETLSDLGPESGRSTEELAAALGRTTNTVVALRHVARDDADPNSEGMPGAPKPAARSARLRLWPLAASVLLAIAGAWLFAARGTYETGVGEQRSVMLEDGSRIEMNSRSRVRVRYSATVRRIELLQGQVLFDVARNRTRPFVVRSGEVDVRAVGTKFDVYRRPEGTVVTVVEGKVAVMPLATQGGGGIGNVSARFGQNEEPGSTQDEVLVAAGEQTTVRKSAPTQPRRANVAAATAWTRRTLVFDAAPLDEVAAEFNRYNKRQIVIVKPAPGTLNVSGVFSSADPQVLLRFLRAQPDLLVEEEEREIRITPR